MYKASNPIDENYLRLDETHEMYYQRYGNPEGQAIVFLHGGPGGGIAPDYHRYFNPEKYHIVLFDQRGCGKSRPFSELKANTTWDIVEDIEKLRTHLGIEKWAVFGGSWGACLSLAYATKHAGRVEALFLRGIFTLRKSELDWFYQEGASNIFPDAWESYLAPIPEEERGDLVAAYFKRLTSEDPAVRAEASKAWSIWEATTSKLIPDANHIEEAGGDEFADAFARIECHYFVNKGFFEYDGYLLDQVDKFRDIPAIIVQGRYDVVCPAKTAWDLHRKWPESSFEMIGDAGHSLGEEGIANCLVEATDYFIENANLKDFKYSGK